MYHNASSRRTFLRLAGTAALGWLAPSACAGPARGDERDPCWPGFAPAANPWATAAAIRARVTPPVFPRRDFLITDFGAVADGEKNCTEAIGRAIAACQAAGGGRVVATGGAFLTGPIALKTGIDLHIAEGAVLRFSREPRHYLPVVMSRWEGVELMNYSPLIYAYGQHNIAITGGGTLDGQANEEFWWPWKGGAGRSGPNQAAGRERLMAMGAAGTAVADRVFGEGHYLRPNFVQPYRCSRVLIEGVTIVNSPMWEIHPVLSRNVIVRDVRISSHGPNNDGCDPESCSDVLVERCHFDTGDDCVALKSGRNNDGRRVNVPVENVVISDCVMADGHGGVTIGSEISGGARNVFAERCRMDSPRLDRALRIKTNSVRGGVIEHVYMREVEVGQVAEALVAIDFFYEEGDAGKHPPVVRDVEVRRVRSRKSKYVLLLRGYAHAPIRDVRLIDCTFDGVSDTDIVEHVAGLHLANVKVNGKPALVKPQRDSPGIQTTAARGGPIRHALPQVAYLQAVND